MPFAWEPLVLGAIIALASVALVATGIVRRRPALVVGGVGTLVALLVLFPASCGSTLIGVPAGRPDPNTATCSPLLSDRPSTTVQGGHPDTRGGSTMELAMSRMGTRAVVVATGMLLVTVAGEALVSRRST